MDTEFCWMGMPILTISRTVRSLVPGLAAAALWMCSAGASEESTPLRYTGDGKDLQAFIDRAPKNATVLCDSERQFTFDTPIMIRKPLTLKNLNARLPEGLGRTSLVVVESPGVIITDIELHGNYDSVDQDARAPLLAVHAGGFRIERCRFYDSSKDGVVICPGAGSGDIVGGTVKDIEGFRLGRDAVSISGGNRGARVRDIIVENVKLKTGYLRGAVEISDGTDNIRVSGVYTENCRYAVDVQDHRGASAANTNITVEDVEAKSCRHIIRTANSPRGHANLTLKNIRGISCRFPVQISNTDNVTIEDLTILGHIDSELPPVEFRNCRSPRVKGATIQSARFPDTPIRSPKCAGLTVEGLVRRKLIVPRILGCGTGEFTIGELLAQSDFTDLEWWSVQQENVGKDSDADSYAETENGILDINCPGQGVTAWFKRRFTGAIAVVYEVRCPEVPDPVKNYCPRDMNCFWHCSDPENPPDVLAYGRNGKYNGNFRSYHGMNGYYASTGGRSNTTTRFRRYPRERSPGEPIGHIALNDKDGKAEFLMTPGAWHRMQLVAFRDIIQYIVDERVVYQIRHGDTVAISGGGQDTAVYSDDNFPFYETGYVGFRMTRTRQMFRNFAVYRLVPSKD